MTMKCVGKANNGMAMEKHSSVTAKPAYEEHWQSNAVSCVGKARRCNGKAIKRIGVETKSIEMEVSTMGGKVPTLYRDMLEQTNLLIAGRTGAGKSTVMDGLVYVAMKHYFPSEKCFIFIDNKLVTFGKYAKSPFCAFYADSEMKFDEALNKTYALCQKRYAEMKRKGLVKYDGGDVYLMVDELPNLIIGHKKRQNTLTQIMNICRACNVHVVVGCQNFLSQCIPTTIKVNFTAICGLQVRNSSDSRVVIGQSGLEALPEHGKCLYQTPQRFEKVGVEKIADEDIEEAISYWRKEYAKVKPFKWLGIFFKIKEAF